MRKRVVVVDDSRTMQAALEQIFSLRLGFDVVGLASDAQSAVALIRALKPDLVTIDLCMTYIDGRQLLEMISDVPDMRKVIISASACDNLAMVSSLEASGADACFDKKELSRDPAKFCSKMLKILTTTSIKAPVTASCGVDRSAAAIVTSAGTRAYPIPLDEHARLAALRQTGLANADADELLDLVTSHVAATTDFPTALMTFIDGDRQWIKSGFGFARGAMPRDVAFCNYTLCADDTFIVSDAAKDQRFADNGLVTGEPRIRTYVGQPIVFTGGVKLGAVCLIDTKPRRITPEIIANLRSVTQIAAEIIKQRTLLMAKAAKAA